MIANVSHNFLPGFILPIVSQPRGNDSDSFFSRKKEFQRCKNNFSLFSDLKQDRRDMKNWLQLIMVQCILRRIGFNEYFEAIFNSECD